MTPVVLVLKFRVAIRRLLTLQRSFQHPVRVRSFSDIIMELLPTFPSQRQAASFDIGKRDERHFEIYKI